MRLRLDTKKIEFVYSNTGTTDISTIDIVKEFTERGGKITPNTEVEFSRYFPKSDYQKTALTDTMPQSYLCIGSASASFYDGNDYLGAIALSVYKDKTGHDPSFGDHKNLYLQYQTTGKTNHTNKIDNRHIKLSDKLTIVAQYDGKEIEKVTV